MEGSDFLLAGVLFLFAAVAAVPLASRLGIGAVLDICWQELQLVHGGWGLLATSMRSSTFRNSAWYS
ncbi:hypothetical protein CJZ48_002891 [Escherichia coli]|uniref:Glutathione-regulated potassium-efflux system protein (K(+)/H(+)antiporter) n=1 Tax=Escherichia coli TaxID=562 RepID=A0A377ACB7_ECOLX|nr:hypothetical protein [Escherichia coli]STL03640.1 glutathione-regulated potassium-efflux system protein (K(+)/H(+)antiporter) [Escherichia coli]